MLESSSIQGESRPTTELVHSDEKNKNKRSQNVKKTNKQTNKKLKTEEGNRKQTLSCEEGIWACQWGITHNRGSVGKVRDPAVARVHKGNGTKVEPKK